LNFNLKGTRMAAAATQNGRRNLSRQIVISLTEEERGALSTLLENAKLDTGSNRSAKIYGQILKQLTTPPPLPTKITVTDDRVQAAARALAAVLFVDWASLPPEDPDPSPWRDILHVSAGKAEYIRAARQIVEAALNARLQS
jgi:hypothetical protein